MFIAPPGGDADDTRDRGQPGLGRDEASAWCWGADELGGRFVGDASTRPTTSMAHTTFGG